MKVASMALFLAGAIGAAGCGRRPEPAPEPISVALWQEMPIDKKYDPETFERLKEGEPALATAEGWEKFQRTVVIPGRRKEKPNLPATRK